jgi:hypothetical protein
MTFKVTCDFFKPRISQYANFKIYSVINKFNDSLNE